MASPEERRVRRSLAKVGLRLLKSRRRADLTIDDRAGYAVQRRSNGRFVCPGNYGLTLDEARACVVSARKGSFDSRALDELLAFDDSALKLLEFNPVRYRDVMRDLFAAAVQAHQPDALYLASRKWPPADDILDD
jgi:hypothetical protein